jgi:CHAT domain-containing protein
MDGTDMPRRYRPLLLVLALFAALQVASPLAAATEAEVRDHVFVTLQRATSSVAGKALQQAVLRQQAGNKALGALMRERQDLSDRQSEAQAELARVARQNGAEAEARSAALQATLSDLRRGMAALDDRIEAAFPAFRELTNPRPMTREEVQRTLKPGEVLVVTLTSDYDVVVWAISATRAAWNVAPFEQGELDGSVRLLRKMLDVTTRDRGAEALDDDDGQTDISTSSAGFDRALAHDLYKRILAPLQPVLDGADHLIAVTDGPLTSLPLAVLVTSPPEGADGDPEALRRTEWLIDRYAMTVLPNVSSLRALRRATRAALSGVRRPFVGFGDPIFHYEDVPGAPTGMADEETTGYTSRGVFETVRDVARLAQLPNTATELRRLARLTGSDDSALYLGRAATESAVRAADLDGVAILAFATHGLLTGELTGLAEPALVFTPPEAPGPGDDALLTASEAATLKLSADLIILSACNTAASDGTPGAEGLSGLARAFIYAGARSILVSHWPVDDHATSVLTTGMVAEMQAGTPRGEALRRSILKLMREDARGFYAHPRFWAPFILVGDG